MEQLKQKTEQQTRDTVPSTPTSRSSAGTRGNTIEPLDSTMSVSFDETARRRLEQEDHEGVTEASPAKAPSPRPRMSVLHVLVEQYELSKGPEPQQRSSSPTVRRGQFVMTESEQDILYGDDQRVFAESSWTHTSSAAQRSIGGPQQGFPGGGFNPNQLGQTLRAMTGKRPGRAGEGSPERVSEGHHKPWPPMKSPIKYNGDRLRNQTITGRHSRRNGGKEVLRDA